MTTCHCALESKWPGVLVEFSSLCFERHLISLNFSVLCGMTLLNCQQFSFGGPSSMEMSMVRHWRRNPFHSRCLRLVWMSLFFHEDSCWSASKTLFGECPKWRWVPWKTVAPSLRSDKQRDGRRCKSGRASHASSSLWIGRVGLEFFRAWCWLPTDDMRESTDLDDNSFSKTFLMFLACASCDIVRVGRFLFIGGTLFGVQWKCILPKTRERKGNLKGRANVHVAAFAVLSGHPIAFGVLGCHGRPLMWKESVCA